MASDKATVISYSVFGHCSKSIPIIETGANISTCDILADTGILFQNCKLPDREKQISADFIASASAAQNAQLDRQIGEMLQANIIRPSTSLWQAPVVVI